MSILNQIPGTFMLAMYFMSWLVAMWAAFSGSTITQKGTATFMVALWVGLNLLSINSGIAFSFEPILNLPINIYLKDVFVPVLSLIIAVMLGTEGVLTGTLIAFGFEVVGYGLFAVGFLRL